MLRSRRTCPKNLATHHSKTFSTRVRCRYANVLSVPRRDRIASGFASDRLRRNGSDQRQWVIGYDFLFLFYRFPFRLYVLCFFPRSDFHQLLPEIERAIEECTFLAIDGEFTGLHNGTMVSAYDTAAQYYQKLRNNCMDFLMVQFGLCAVKYDAASKKYDFFPTYGNLNRQRVLH